MTKATEEGRMTVQETIDNLASLVVAGYETTASTVDFTLYELAKNPECQQKLRDELHMLDGEPSYEDLEGAHRLFYLDAVVKEGYVPRGLSHRIEHDPGKSEDVPHSGAQCSGHDGRGRDSPRGTRTSTFR